METGDSRIQENSLLAELFRREGLELAVGITTNRGRVFMTRKRSNEPRVFCIGWHKTGTSTLGLALIKLGYSVLGCRLDMVHPLRRGELDSVLELAGRYDAVQDVPWACLFKELDQRFPAASSY